MKKAKKLSVLIGFFLSFCWVPGSKAQDVADAGISPTQQQLKALLSDNSIKGEWAGRPYIQYFSPSGSTVYEETGRAKSFGSWRINGQGQYCSIWPPLSHEVCYGVRVLDRIIYWRSGDDIYSSSLIEGNIFKQ